jgi:hypothetical protein
MKREIALYGLCHIALQNGGSIRPLIVDSDLTNGTGLMNPSVFVDGDSVLVNIRHVNYTLYHSEGKGFPHQWGPLQYIHPEDDQTLRTENYIAHLDNTLNALETYPVSMTYNTAPTWNFIGLEDARLFRWDDKLYLCGVRRDHIDNRGTGRMDLSEIEFTGDCYREVSRYSIPAPYPNTSYCEKNWMPILDLPYHWIKWSNPTEVVRFDLEKRTTETAHLDELKTVSFPRDLRGGSQVVRWKDYFVAVTHEVDLFNDSHGRKDGKYLHRIIVWDMNWNIVHTTDTFTFMKGEIEFVTGLAIRESDVLISFGFQDNAAYIISLPTNLFEAIVGMT